MPLRRLPCHVRVCSLLARARTERKAAFVELPNNRVLNGRAPARRCGGPARRAAHQVRIAKERGGKGEAAAPAGAPRGFLGTKLCRPSECAAGAPMDDAPLPPL
jgi:hypothetical protein